MGRAHKGGWLVRIRNTGHASTSIGVVTQPAEIVIRQLDMSRTWYKSFLAALDEEPNVARACREAGIARSRAYQARDEDPKFAEAWDECIEASVDNLEAAAFKRALEGSDYLMNILLRAHRKKYVEKQQHEVTGADGAPFSFTLSIGGQRDDSGEDG